MQTYEKCVDYIQTHFMLLREERNLCNLFKETETSRVDLERCEIEYDMMNEQWNKLVCNDEDQLPYEALPFCPSLAKLRQKNNMYAFQFGIAFHGEL